MPLHPTPYKKVVTIANIQGMSLKLPRSHTSEPPPSKMTMHGNHLFTKEPDRTTTSLKPIMLTRPMNGKNRPLVDRLTS
jgi:hypothetical protein